MLMLPLGMVGAVNPPRFRPRHAGSTEGIGCRRDRVPDSRRSSRTRPQRL